MLPGVWPMFGCIFSTNYIHRNICIWWRVHILFNDITFTYICPFLQVNIYWVIRSQIFISHVTSPKSPFSKFQVASDSARWDISKQPIISYVLCQNTLDFFFCTRVPYQKVHYIYKYWYILIIELFNCLVSFVHLWIEDCIISPFNSCLRYHTLIVE